MTGAVRVKSFTAEPEAIAAYGPLADESGRQSFELRLVGAAKGVLIARLSGVEDRDRPKRCADCGSIYRVRPCHRRGPRNTTTPI